MKRLAQVLVITILTTLASFAQAPNKNWVLVIQKQNTSVYIDTANVHQFENQLSVLSITAYKQPQTIVSVNGDASYIKSQILFNTTTKKYSVIGTLYYDKNLKIVGENSTAGFSSSGDKFELPIDNDDVMSAIYNKAYEFFKPGLAAADTTAQTREIPDINRDATKTLPINKTEPSKQTNVEEKKPANENVQEYDSSGETNPKSRIFTDGKKYSFQVSSWKIKTKAESEVKRLKAEGHNAFLTEGIVRGSTWYRVRIGFFNSLEETESYMKKMR